MSAMSGIRAWIIKDFRVPELQTQIALETLSLSSVRSYPRLAIPVEARIAELVTKKAAEIVTAEREAVLVVFHETLARDSTDRCLDGLACKALVLGVELQELYERVEPPSARKRRPAVFAEGLAKKEKKAPLKLLPGQRRIFGYFGM